jgi:hypothetical protein
MWRSLTFRVALAGTVIAILFGVLVVVFLDASDSASRSWTQRSHADEVLDSVNLATNR